MISNPSGGALPRSTIVMLSSTTLLLGGTERYLVDMTRELVDLGHNAVIIARDRGRGAGTEYAELRGLPIIQVTGTLSLGKELRGLNPDVIYAFGLRWSLTVRLLRMLRATSAFTKGAGTLTLLSAQRGLDTWRRRIHWWIDRITARYIDCFIANSQAASKLLTRKLALDPGRLYFEAPALSDAWFRPTDVPEPAEPVILVIGTARPEKDHEAMFRALKSIEELGWSAIMYTNAVEEYQARAKSLGILHRFRIEDQRPLSPNDYDQGTILLHPSLAESSPRVVLEATARGLCIVATDVGDVKLMVDDRARIVQPGDRAALNAALRDALNEPRRSGITREEQGIPSQREIAERFIQRYARQKTEQEANG